MLIAWVIAGFFVIQVYLLANAFQLYYPIIGAVGARLFPRRERALQAPPPSRIAVLIAAHNEARVLGPTLQALAAQRYPLAAFDVLVVADNCRDETAEVSRAAGALVWERQSDGPSTKGLALSSLWLQQEAGRYSAVVILDADNEAAPDFLGAMAAELGRGYAVVQGLRRAKPAMGRTAGLDALSELCTHRVGAAGRRYFGVNGPIMGWGVAYDAALFDRLIRSIGTTVVEDCEWQARLALEGVAIHWCDRAVVFDEKTATASAMGTQRNRWMAGRGHVARAYALPLLKAGLLRFNWSALDMAAFLLAPPRVLTLMGFALLAACAALGVPGLWPWGLWVACLMAFGFYVLLGLYLDGAPRAAYWALFKGVLELPRFALQMTKATWKALTGQRVDWQPTPHGAKRLRLNKRPRLNL